MEWIRIKREQWRKKSEENSRKEIWMMRSVREKELWEGKIWENGWEKLRKAGVRKWGREGKEKWEEKVKERERRIRTRKWKVEAKGEDIRLKMKKKIKSENKLEGKAKRKSMKVKM